jgi:hypothetical protein
MCIALRLHMSAAPPRVGLTQALGISRDIMGSWIICSCGARIHKNLFAGARVCVLIADEHLDQIPEGVSANDALNVVVFKGDKVVQCRQCDRLYIERRDGDIYECFTKERTSLSPNFSDTTFDVDSDHSQRDA